MAVVEGLAARFEVDLADSVLEAKLDPRYPVRRVVAGGLVLEVASGEEGRRRLRLEAAGRRWAILHGITTPGLLDADHEGAWMVSPWLDVTAAEGRRYVEASVDMADRLSAVSDLPTSSGESSSWRSPRRSVGVRGVRSVSGGLPLRLWFATKSQMNDLAHPYDVAHGDFYPRNVLGTAQGVAIVDWEYLGNYPRHTDLARMWSVLRDVADRQLVLDHLLDRADGAERRRIGTLLLWHSLRLLGENLSAPGAQREPANLAHAKAMLPEVSDVAREVGAWPL